MKKLAFLVILALVTALPVYAQLGETDNSSFTIQNLGAAPASISVTFYAEADLGGTPYIPSPLRPGVSNPFTLAPGARQEIYMPAVSGLPDGRYSVVIESTEPIAVIANLIGEGATFYNGSYSGFSAGATTIYFPATHYQFYGWNSLISVQNTTASSITANLYIYNEAGTQVATDSKTIPAFASYHWDLETIGAGLRLPTRLNGSAKVVCTGACVGTDNQTAAGGYTQSYNAFLAGDTTLYAPALYNDYYHWISSLKVQNIGDGPTDIDVIYYVQGGGVCDPPAETIQPGQSLYHYLPAKWETWGCTSPTRNKVISAVITSSAEDIAGIANAAGKPGLPTAGQAQTYGVFASSEGAAKVGLPAIMNNYYKWITSFTCQNLGSTDANVTYSYSGVGCPTDPMYPGCQYTLAPGQAREVYQPADLDATTGLFAVTVTATGAPIACIANETLPVYNGPPGPGDWSMSYNGFGQ